MGVVDLLEVVQVEDQQRRGPPLAFGEGQLVGPAQVPGRVVEQPGLGVGVGPFAQLADQDRAVQGQDRRHREQCDERAARDQRPRGQRPQAEGRQLQGELVAAEQDAHHPGVRARHRDHAEHQAGVDDGVGQQREQQRDGAGQAAVELAGPGRGEHPGRGVHGQDDRRGAVDLPVDRPAVRGRHRPQHPDVEVGVDDHHDERAQYRWQQQGRGEGPDRGQVHVVGLGGVAPDALDAGHDLGVQDPGHGQGGEQYQRRVVEPGRVQQPGEDQADRQQLHGEDRAEQPSRDGPDRPAGDLVQPDRFRGHTSLPRRRRPTRSCPSAAASGVPPLRDPSRTRRGQ